MVPLHVPWPERPDEGLKALASDSGGQMVMLKKAADWAPACAHVIDELHAQYTVAFSPNVGANVHKVDVKVAGKSLTVRTRKTYGSSGAPKQH
jgi:hypothetical protein